MRSALTNAESKNSQASSFSKELQIYLKLTYKKEREQYNIKKGAADKQLEAAKQWVCGPIFNLVCYILELL